MRKLFHRLGDFDHVIWDWNGTLLNDAPHAVDTINLLLEPRGLPLMNMERYREVRISQFDLSHYFDYVFGIADRLAFSKVQRGHDLLRESGVPPSRTVLIGDTDHDLEVAQALGISVLLVTRGHQSASRLKRLHHDVIDVSEL